MKVITRKQFGDAGEHLVLAELGFAGVPAAKMPDNWPGYDLTARHPSGDVVRISVKTRSWSIKTDFIVYSCKDEFDWLAVVLIGCPGEKVRRIFIMPRSFADDVARANQPGTKTENERYWPLNKTPEIVGCYEDNFTLEALPWRGVQCPS
jgi:hypothetical protein